MNCPVLASYEDCDITYRLKFSISISGYLSSGGIAIDVIIYAYNFAGLIQSKNRLVRASESGSANAKHKVAAMKTNINSR